MNNNELNQVYGGKGYGKLFFALGGLITFIIGVIDGYFRPLKCN